MTRIVADATRCVGAGQCVLTDPATFDQDGASGVVVLLRAAVSDEGLALARAAEYLCPGRALSLVE
ncbi:ferredoxin [Jidongwangia harbinensis]|uniref:ferredoxin n=1 Tax=Jidongwangia harbinensis TaxID=2878561 RepID=UPI001CD96BAA|nr:ferredoxin [Jidongwangia harbinensis]MCA2217142.1 ferredoxin [Jidongwangia harbinensis]